MAVTQQLKIPIFIFSAIAACVVVSRLLIVGDELLSLFWLPAGVMAVIIAHFPKHRLITFLSYFIVIPFAYQGYLQFDTFFDALTTTFMCLSVAMIEFGAAFCFAYLVSMRKVKYKTIDSIGAASAFAAYALFSGAIVAVGIMPLFGWYFQLSLGDSLRYGVHTFPTQLLSLILIYPIYLYRNELRDIFSRIKWDFALFVIVTPVILYLVFSPQFIHSPIQSIPFFLYPIMLYSLLRLGTAACCICMVGLFIVAIYGATIGSGPFGQHDEFSVIITQLFAVVVASTMLMLAGLKNSESRSKKQLSTLNEKLEHEVEERTSELKQEVNAKHSIAKQLEILALTDALTNLPNRNGLYKSITEKLLRHRRFSLLFCDLDRFKNINDSMGHMAGDELLSLVAERLTSVLQKNDVIARWGGDEFVCVVEGDRAQGEKFAECLRALFNKPFSVNKQTVYSAISIGIAHHPHHASEPDKLLRLADAALFKAKKEGRNQVFICDENKGLDEVDYIGLEADMRSGLQNDEFIAYFQPKYRISDGMLTGHEALVRWHRSDGSIMLPNEFIPAAEELGIISSIGNHILKQACMQTKVWRREQRDLTIAVNVSPRQVKFGSLLPNVYYALVESGLPQNTLELEITESLIMAANTEQLNILEELRRMGVKISLDDFGTGYSSLSYLTKFTFDTIKIDQSFIRDITRKETSLVLVESIIHLAKRLGKEVVAEGIESVEQLNLLRELGCDSGQGYYFGMPKPADNLGSLESFAAARL